jgi:hypothetical protein
MVSHRTRAQVRCLRTTLMDLETSQLADIIHSHLFITLVGLAFPTSLDRLADDLKEYVLHMNDTTYNMLFTNIQQPVFASNRDHVENLTAEILVKLIWARVASVEFYSEGFDDIGIDDYSMTKCILSYMYVASFPMNPDLGRLTTLLLDPNVVHISGSHVLELVEHLKDSDIDCSLIHFYEDKYHPDGLASRQIQHRFEVLAHWQQGERQDIEPFNPESSDDEA